MTWYEWVGVICAILIFVSWPLIVAKIIHKDYMKDLEERRR